VSDLQLHARKPCEAQDARASRRKVNHAAARVRTAVIDPYSNAPPVAQIGHAHLRAECQRAMRSGTLRANNGETSESRKFSLTWA